jgi:high-affinity nickel-transport protein
VLTAQKLHVHIHRHVGTLPADPLPAYGPLATFGIGVLHGIGAETPTQVLLFATAAGVGTLLFGIGVLGAFVGGMLISNGVVAVAFMIGTRAGMRMPLVYNSFAVAIAVFSIAVGISYLGP